MQSARTSHVPGKKAKIAFNQKPLKITPQEMKRATLVNSDLLKEAPEIFARARLRGDIRVR
jgi:hypothetical protein